MGYFEHFFLEELHGQAYKSEWEAVGDIRAWVDLCLNLVFYGRDAETERLDMRGVVITPQEFALALKDWTLENRRPQAERLLHEQAIRQELVNAREYLQSRRERSRSEGCLPRVFEVTEAAGADELEEFCFYLALVVEYDRKYERLYGYLQDNVAAKLPTVGLGISLYQKTVVPPVKESSFGLWFKPESRLWKQLLKPGQPEEGQSRLSQPMAVRDEVLAYIQGRETGSGSSEDADPAPGAVRVRLVYTWEDLVLEQEQLKLLHRICDRVRFRRQVMEDWGFGKKSPYGNGVSAVFYGAPGTGKTMAAQVIGKALDRPVWKIDLSQMVSKYIGETEKNLSKLFQQAREQDVILFFDEADSLFAKRSGISGSNDRYANMETGYLLQQFEEFEGISILATNYISNIDDAFRRRIKFYVRFPFPDREMREALWNRMLPAEAVVEEPLRIGEYAARHELPGSDIKEVVTNAAFLAAAAGRGIRNADIVEALNIQYGKLGKKMTGQGGL